MNGKPIDYTIWPIKNTIKIYIKSSSRCLWFWQYPHIVTGNRTQNIDIMLTTKLRFIWTVNRY